MTRPPPTPKPPPKPDAAGACAYLGADGEMRFGSWSLRKGWLSVESADGATSAALGGCGAEALASILLAALARSGNGDEEGWRIAHQSMFE